MHIKNSHARLFACTTVPGQALWMDLSRAGAGANENLIAVTPLIKAYPADVFVHRAGVHTGTMNWACMPIGVSVGRIACGDAIHEK